MAEYILSATATADLTKEQFEERDIRVVFFHYTIDGEEKIDDLGQSISFHDFYQMMEQGAMTKTSQLSIGEYMDYFRGMLTEGKDILHVTLSSGLSGDYNSARSASEMLKEEFPERKIYVVDSLGASTGYGLLMDKLAEKRKEGLSLEELRDYAEEHKLELNHWFFSTDLKYYVRGGRISKASGFFGTMLRICPLLNMNDQGKLIPREKIRTVKKVEAALVEKMVENAVDGLDYSDKVFISMSDCPDYANAVKEMVEAKFPKLNGKVVINSIGTTIGSHTGPGTVALFFWGKKRGA